jgi:NADPH:quinone reductase-like Zn-dependent oxidoreductase
MKAIVQEGYGSPDTLKLREIEMPPSGDDGVLVEVHAASINALDWHLARGVPFFIPILEAIARVCGRTQDVLESTQLTHRQGVGGPEGGEAGHPVLDDGVGG